MSTLILTVRYCLVDHRELVAGSNHKLRVLLFVQHVNGDEDDAEASRVPRWDKPYQSWILGLRPYAKFFDASGTLNPCIGKSEIEKALVLKGIDIDRVVTVDYSLRRVANNSSAMFMVIKKLWKSIVVEIEKNPPNYLGIVNG